MQYRSTLFKLLGIILPVHALLLNLTYHHDEVQQKFLNRRDVYENDLKYSPELAAYYVELTIGDAPQALRLTLSSYPWTYVATALPSDFCSNPSNSYTCVVANLLRTYNPTVSTTFKNLTLGWDIKGIGKGYYATENFQIGPNPIENVDFIVGTNLTSEPTLGLGVNDPFGKVTFLENLLAIEAINSLSYAVYLNDFGTNASQITVGTIDPAKYNGNLLSFQNSTNLFGAGSFLDVSDLQFSNGSVSSTFGQSFSARLVFDTQLIWLGAEDFTTIISSFGAIYNSTAGAYLCDCSQRWSGKSITFSFSKDSTEVSITVDASQIITLAISTAEISFLIDGSPACTVLLDIISNSAFPAYDIVLGAPFFRAAYIVFDFSNNQTSLAPAILNSTVPALVQLNPKGVLDTPGILKNDTHTASTTSSTNLVPPPTSTSSTNTSLPSVPAAKSHTGAIVGGAVGGAGFWLVIVGLGVLFILRRRRQEIPKLLPGAPEYELDTDGERHEIHGKPLTNVPSKPSTMFDRPTALGQPISEVVGSQPMYNVRQPVYELPENREAQ